MNKLLKQVIEDIVTGNIAVNTPPLGTNKKKKDNGTKQTLFLLRPKLRQFK